MFQTDVSGPENGEYGSRIGRRHGRSQQQGRQIADAFCRFKQYKEEPDNRACEQCGENHAHCSQHCPGQEYRADFRDPGIQPARKKNYTEGNGSNRLRDVNVFKLYAKSVATADHPYSQKQQQRRYAVLVARLSGQNTYEE
ncbi:hypothetical protein DSECCO2_320660 [anaerobic digester metagenome]